ncbi:FAD-dependent monooxygenase [Pseudooceanicola aestuarii]|uniref:FAD-dependent monooxygenase n=1 Tax=Pseudooceanicola aestuarii TaxID=2697319 RepID=UPI0013D4DAD0|nr:FAD-dependent monooxygenase [Pseudooceanicola aestuarii]
MALAGVRIAVIGAGVGGLSVARALRLRGAEVTVLEQAQAITEVGAGVQITPNGLAVLRGLGLADRLRGPRAQAVRLFSHRGPESLCLNLSDLPAGQGYHFVHRADLIALLAAGAREAGVRIRLLQQVDRIAPGTAEDRPVIHLRTGAQMRPDLVIGADGLHSRLRAALVEAAQPRFTGQVAWRAVVPGDPADPAEAHLYMGPGRHLVTYPLREGTLRNIVAVEERSEWAADSWTLAGDPQLLRQAFWGSAAPVRALLERVEAVNLWGLHRHPVARRWVTARTALLGDAAHPTLPFLAQGANLALEDAWVLAEALHLGPDPAAALARYEAARLPRARRAITAANRNAWKYHLRSAPMQLAAHLALRAGQRLAPRQLGNPYGWLYDLDVTGGTQLPAPRCPSEVENRP